MGLIVISNREPYAPKVLTTGPASGQTAWLPSIGGLTSALDPVIQRLGGSWVAWGEALPEVERIALPVPHPRYTVERLRLSEAEVEAYYHGFSNAALWPMSHYFVERARYLGAEWQVYSQVNARFTAAAAARHAPGDDVWVHDYQLALVPELLRERLGDDARIGFFWHIPWPAPDVFRTLPWDAQILRGLLGADLIGMHTADYVEHFLSACRVVLGAETGPGLVQWQGRTVRVEARPIGIDVAEFTRLAESPEVQTKADRIRQGLQTAMLLGVDRLDYTKGIPERLEAFDTYLDRHPGARRRVTLVQVAVPSREQVGAYAQLRAQVEGLVGRINGKHAEGGWSPIHYVYRGLAREDLIAHYRAADALLVTPLRDGLNLVAKEFLACSRDGVLLLSRFAGADRELPEALHVNAFDTGGLAEQIHAAVQMPLDEKQARLTRLRARLIASDLHTWTADFLNALRGDLAQPSVAWPGNVIPTTPRPAAPFSGFSPPLGQEDGQPAPILLTSVLALPPTLLALGERPLLILCDYDGTLAPIAATPRQADPQPGAQAALTRLLHQPGRRLAVITGRRSVQVYGFVPLPDLMVVGLHGMEWPGQSPPPPDRAALEAIARQVPTQHGLRLEDKRWTLAVHYRNVPEDRQAELEARLGALKLPEHWERIAGKKVQEFRPAGYGKGRAARRVIETNPGFLPVFLGDDATDEEAFAVVNELGGVSVKVGPGVSLARWRLPDSAAVVALLGAWGEMQVTD